MICIQKMINLITSIKIQKIIWQALSDPTPPDNWISQLKRTFADFDVGDNKHLVQFYMVNSLKNEIDEWKLSVNLHHITLDEMWERLNI